jgi:hypothetical protein
LCLGGVEYNPYGLAVSPARESQGPIASHPGQQLTQHRPATAIDRRHASSTRKSGFASDGSVTAATQSAPSVEKGETSTSDDPTLIDSAAASGSPPPTSRTRPGTVGRKAARTTPEVLLSHEIAPVTKAMTTFSVAGVASRAKSDASSSMPHFVDNVRDADECQGRRTEEFNESFPIEEPQRLTAVSRISVRSAPERQRQAARGLRAR